MRTDPVTPPPEVGWAAVATLVLALEAYALRTRKHSTATYTVKALARRHPVALVALVGGWLWLGLHFFTNVDR